MLYLCHTNNGFKVLGYPTKRGVRSYTQAIDVKLASCFKYFIERECFV
nr:MAG TPA: hypothetical protein [Caudoviricetes sp.]DAS12946.1 MAG TPA: hypothetical protein [Caudoviricetes sp.]